MRSGMGWLAGAAAALAAAWPSPLRVRAEEPAAADYVGAAACASCHKAMHAKWKGGRHSRMLQQASAESVRGDFAAGRLTLRGRPYALRAERGVVLHATAPQGEVHTQLGPERETAVCAQARC